MAVQINFNICDNAPECSGAAVCPTGAIYWDNEALNPMSGKGSLCIDNKKCIACGKCAGEDGCPVGAIIFADSEAELEKLTKDCKTDLTKVEDLFVERYGAAPIDETLCIEKEQLQKILDDNKGIILIEKYAEWSVQCLLSSIPVSTIMDEIRDVTKVQDICFYRMDITTDAEECTKLPVLEIYQGGKMQYRIDGYMDNSQLHELRAMLQMNLK